jgi:hypothetical protein
MYIPQGIRPYNSQIVDAYLGIQKSNTTVNPPLYVPMPKPVPIPVPVPMPLPVFP